MYFKASLDLLSKILSFSLIAFLASMIWILNRQVPSSSFSPDYVLGILFLALIIAPLFYFPLGYGIENNYAFVKFPLRKKQINFQEIQLIEAVDAAVMRNSFRTFGSGGYFGYWGKFRNIKLGGMIWYATQRKNYVLITTVSGTHIILTPDNAEQFIQSCRENMYNK